MRNYEEEFRLRVEWIRNVMKQSGAQGIVFGNSGGKDSALTGILCKAACDNTLGVLLPCESSRNFGEDSVDALALAQRYGIESYTVDVTATKRALCDALPLKPTPSAAALQNVNPRLRMTVLYTVAQSRNSLVAGTGNRSERYVGYFTKWGDGAYDFNPIGDLCATEVTEFLKFLGAPESIVKKAPSAGLFEGQTDEEDLGFTYQELDRWILHGEASEQNKEKFFKMHRATEHKREAAKIYEKTEK